MRRLYIQTKKISSANYFSPKEKMTKPGIALILAVGLLASVGAAQGARRRGVCGAHSAIVHVSVYPFKMFLLWPMSDPGLTSTHP